MLTRIHHPTGDYSFLPGIDPYSCGVVAGEGFEIVRVTLQKPLPWRQGFEFVDRLFERQRRPRAALCAIELRSPRPFTMPDFIEFNRQYCSVLEGWGVYVDGLNPIARTNICPVGLEFDEPALEALSFVRPNAILNRRTFVVAGAGELIAGTLDNSGIIRSGETSADAIREKARYVCDVMEERLIGLGGTWDDVTTVTAYTIHPLEPILENLIIARMSAAKRFGVRWLFSRPPVVDIEFEMDLRGVATEWVV